MKRLSLPVAALLLSSCASWRWSGGGPPPEPSPEPAEISSAPRPRTPEPVVPPSTPLQRETAVFYSDLGPEEIDVSEYPLQQRTNYRVYARACSRCHGLARSINSPLVSRTWWEFYVMSMRARGSLSGRHLTKDDVEAVLDFLEYDGVERKQKRAKEFEKVTAELKRRYEALMTERMRRLQEQPSLLR